MMLVKEVMTANPACCLADTGLQEVAQMMVDNDCGEIPVVESMEAKRPIGVITDRDIVCRTVARGLNPLDLTVADSMTEPCVTVTPNMSLAECSGVMEENKIRRVPVVDTKGYCCGIVALADIALNAKQSVAAEVIKEVSEKTISSAASGR
ncbi:MAG TPA: CBS domain-containing protein [Pyrinomonadaceae bacterium]|nr:CBS domain-containing protein [Pyrinomonadaceae bacterium]